MARAKRLSASAVRAATAAYAASASATPATIRATPIPICTNMEALTHGFIRRSKQAWGKAEAKMSDEQIPFEFPDLVSNPEPRCPCILLLDISGSMSGKPLTELNEGVRIFKEQLMADNMAVQRVEVALVTFGPVNRVAEFQTVDLFHPPHLGPTGDTPMGSAIITALDMLAERKKNYQAAGVNYYRPWIFLITDGSPTDTWQEAAARVHAGDNNERKSFSFFGVGVQGADMSTLTRICSPSRPPVRLEGLNFREMFVWLSASLKGVSASQMGRTVKLAPPGWAAS